MESPRLLHCLLKQEGGSLEENQDAVRRQDRSCPIKTPQSVLLVEYSVLGGTEEAEIDTALELTGHLAELNL